MATIIFYQKPGCSTNARQMQALRAAGHDVIAKDILNEPWCTQTLRRFFGDMPVASWFNRAALRIKSGEIDPGTCDAASALALMLDDPLLIRRPLIEVGSARCAGFNQALARALLGQAVPDELDRCSRKEADPPCPRMPIDHSNSPTAARGQDNSPSDAS